MADRPLTERQEHLLVTLLDLRAGRIEQRGYPPTPNELAMAMGIERTARRARGPWSGLMAPAQHIIGTLNGLRGRGLVGTAGRRDRKSGTAYALTDAGLERARELKAAREGR